MPAGGSTTGVGEEGMEVTVSVSPWNAQGNHEMTRDRDACLLGFCIVRALCSGASTFEGVPPLLLELCLMDADGELFDPSYTNRDQSMASWSQGAYEFGAAVHASYCVFSGRVLLRRASPRVFGYENFRSNHQHIISLARWLNEGLATVVPGEIGPLAAGNYMLIPFAVAERRRAVVQQMIVGTVLGGRAGALEAAAQQTLTMPRRREFSQLLLSTHLVQPWMYVE
jgi:hypothetical protein